MISLLHGSGALCPCCCHNQTDSSTWPCPQAAAQRWSGRQHWRKCQWSQRNDWELQRSLVILVDYSGGGTAQALLVPVHIVTPNVTAAAGARDSDLLLQRPRHRAGLSQHNLCPRPSEDRTDPIPREGGEVILPGDKQEASQNSLQASTCAVSEESEEERSPGHGEDTPRLCFLSLTARPEPTNPSYMSP